jgi:hypothetical protein|tara:strand:- start:1080 stop:1217 length:138 start_codon:yes stop_codon:yes gene_type:complete
MGNLTTGDTISLKDIESIQPGFSLPLSILIALLERLLAVMLNKVI